MSIDSDFIGNRGPESDDMLLNAKEKCRNNKKVNSIRKSYLTMWCFHSHHYSRYPVH